MFFRKTFLIVFLFSVGALLPVLAHAQDQFNSSFNYESSTLPYNWHTSAWTTCAGECNNGNQTREVACRDNAGNPAPSAADCSHSAIPELTRSCDLPDCQWVMESCPTHIHYTGGGGGCGGAGGGGYQGGGQDCGDDKVSNPNGGGDINQDQL